MADYRKEMKKLRKHRKAYRPAMSMLLRLHRTAKSSGLPVELIDHEMAVTILELIDVGYVAEDALTVRRRFNSIAGLRYDGAYPFTDSGDIFFRESRNVVMRIIDAIRSRRDPHDADIRPQQ